MSSYDYQPSPVIQKVFVLKIPIVISDESQILQHTTQLHTVFLGLGGELTALVRQTEVKALAVQLLFRLERATLGEKVRASNTFKQYLSLVKG
jgi:hypothetical protein